MLLKGWSLPVLLNPEDESWILVDCPLGIISLIEFLSP